MSAAPAVYVYKRALVRLLVGLYDRAGGVLLRRAAPPLAAPPRHVCTVVLNQIGDAVLALPTIDAIARMCPGSRLTVVAGQATAALFRARAWKVEVREFDALWQKVVRQLLGRERRLGEIARAAQAFVRRVREVDADAVVAFQPDLVANCLLGRTGVRDTFGFVDAGSGFWLGHPVAMPRTGHQVERLFALARAFADALGAEPPRLEPPRLEIDEERVEAMRRRLAAAGAAPERVVVLHPFASAETKDWPLERWREVGEWLVEHRYLPLVVGGRRDAIAASGIPRGVDLGGPLDLPDLAALLSIARVFVGIDSGPGHIAAAVGCPLVSIFSSVNDVERWRPYGRGPVTVLHRPVGDRRRFPYERRDLPPGTRGNPYLDRIGAEAVLREIRRLAATPRP